MATIDELRNRIHSSGLLPEDQDILLQKLEAGLLTDEQLQAQIIQTKNELKRARQDFENWQREEKLLTLQASILEQLQRQNDIREMEIAAGQERGHTIKAKVLGYIQGVERHFRRMTDRALENDKQIEVVVYSNNTILCHELLKWIEEQV